MPRAKCRWSLSCLLRASPLPPFLASLTVYGPPSSLFVANTLVPDHAYHHNLCAPVMEPVSGWLAHATAFVRLISLQPSTPSCRSRGGMYIKPRNAGYRGAAVRVALGVDSVQCSATADDSSLVGEGRPAIRQGLLNLLNAKFLFVCEAIGALIASFPLQLPITTTDASATAVLSADAAAGQIFSLFRNQV